MLVVHAFWSLQRGFCLWAEDSDRPVKSGSQAVRSARRHTFAAADESLVRVGPGRPATATLLLPSLRSAPLDSPELVRVVPRPPIRTEPVLAPWSVSVLHCTTPDAFGLLERLVGEPIEGIRYGSSVTYLGAVAAFAVDLAERGRVLPTAGHDETGPVGRWRPVVTGPDIVALHALVAAMPPICRAESDWPAQPEGQDPNELVSSALQAFVDTAVRQRLRSGPGLVPARRGRRPKELPALEAWLGSLSRMDGRFTCDTDDLDSLERALKEWADFGIGQSGPARAMFRLTTGESGGNVTDGDTEDEGWRLDFLLQSVADPSLLVPAEQAFSAGWALSRWLDRPEELLLAELGRASRVYPGLAPALRQPRPFALELNTEAAYEFLSRTAGLLSEAGFGVLLPSWWDSRRQLSLALSAASTPIDGVVTKASRFGRDQLVEFQWQLAVGEEILTDEEIRALAETKAPLVRLRGQWVAVDTEQLCRGLEFLKRQPSGQATAGEILALASAHPGDANLPMPLTSVRADGWLGDLLAGTAERRLAPIAAPAGLHATLRPYQERGLSWLAFLSALGLGACLADDMGLGKTIQLLALEALERSERAEDSDMLPTLLLCPMSLVGNWQREAARFAPDLRIYAHHGPERRHGKRLAKQVAGADLVVTTYATATRDIEELVELDWRRLVLDEAQAVKNSLSQSAKAVRRLPAEHRIALTGTPMENRLAELWSVMDFLNPGVLGSAELFRTRYAIPVERHGQTEPAQRLRTITRPYILRRLKTDPQIIDDLPEKIEIKQYCQLTTEQASLYQAVVDDMMEKIESTDGIARRGNVLAAMAKLKQVCNHPAQLLHDRSPVGQRSGKVIRLEEILAEILAEGDRVLCFTQFTEFAEMLLPHLSARFSQDMLYLHGGTPKQRRDEMVERFQSGTGPAIFLLSLKAGGTGLNLTAANHVIHLDRWWNPAVENQATDRAFRIGQKRSVQVRKFVCTGTLEEKIDEMIEDKKALADMVISDGEGWLTELSTGALRELFTLGEGAVGE